MDQPLTALERDLLACVERLVTACETSATELRGLEARSTRKIEAKMTGLVDCVTSLLRSQNALVSALMELQGDAQNYEIIQQKLNASLEEVKTAAKRLNEL